MSDQQVTSGNVWSQDHTFGQDRKLPGETRTLIVAGVTAVMMIVEVSAGLLSGSMALLADGLHMAAHTAALGISVAAYVFARRHAGNRRFSFGTGKVNALGGFTGGVLLIVFSLMMAWESVERLIDPVEIAYGQAIAVAVVGLVVNAVSALILSDSSHACGGHDHDSGTDEAAGSNGPDLNLRSAYLHVIADALTSVAAIAGLLAGKYFGLVWIDPAVGVAGAVVVARWSTGLLKTTGAVLLDTQAPEKLDQQVRQSLLTTGDSLVDFHLWKIGPEIFAMEAVVVSSQGADPDEYRRRLPSDIGLAHCVIEVRHTDASTAESAGEP